MSVISTLSVYHHNNKFLCKPLIMMVRVSSINRVMQIKQTIWRLLYYIHQTFLAGVYRNRTYMTLAINTSLSLKDALILRCKNSFRFYLYMVSYKTNPYKLSGPDSWWNPSLYEHEGIFYMFWSNRHGIRHEREWYIQSTSLELRWSKCSTTELLRHLFQNMDANMFCFSCGHVLHLKYLVNFL